MNRGDIVIVDLRPTNPAAKVRPALVIQNDRDNSRMANTIVAQISSNLRRAGEPTQFSIDATHSDFPTSGLRHASIVNCSNIYTVEQRHVTHVIGSLSIPTMRKIDACLKSALEIT